jgi:hypothetical protein
LLPQVAILAIVRFVRELAHACNIDGPNYEFAFIHVRHLAGDGGDSRHRR